MPYKSLGCNFIHADALEYNFKTYDRIYTYIPVNDPKVLKVFYQRIWDTIAPGTMWLEVHPNRTFTEVTKDAKKLDDGLGVHPILIKE